MTNEPTTSALIRMSIYEHLILAVELFMKIIIIIKSERHDNVIV